MVCFMKKRHKCVGGVVLLATTILAASGAAAATATVGTFTGGDPGDGLDLEGNFTYAVNVGPSGGAGKVGDAIFTPDSISGVSVTAENNIGNGSWGTVAYGDTDNDKNLSTAMDSIRWAAAPNVVTVSLNVEPGAEYKLQILLHEDCCPGRGFNVVINGETEVSNLMPGVTQNGGDPDPTTFQDIKNAVGAVVTYQFVAATNKLVFVLDGPSADSADISDHNAILNGFTLERLSAINDSDNDGLADDWEIKYFTNLDQKGTDDPDQDGLSNTDEQTAQTDPTKPDSDGDGLTDGDEVNQYHTDPLTLGDQDGDLLSDGDEIQTYHTDHTKTDTDGDGFSDYYEVHLLTDPNDAASKPVKTVANLFTGPEDGQGLDLSGNFPYAISFGTEQPGGQIGDATFTPDSVDGVTVDASQVADGWNVDVNFGEDTDEEFTLTSIMGNIRWSNSDNATTPAVTVTLANLQVGASYKLQMLFAERLWARGFDVSVNNRLVAKAFAPFQWQGGFVGPGGATPRTNGVVLTHTFIANSTETVILLDGRPVTDRAMPDHNAIIEGATLELAAAPVDSDSDGLWDAWEMDVFGNLDQTAAGDPDNDGLKNSDEFTSNTDPNKADTDGDGLNDGMEVNTTHTDPAKTDSDGDGLNDGDEVNTYGTDPAKADTDGDTLNDSSEVMTYHTDPLKTDTDGDGKDDATEIIQGGDPTKADPPTQFSNILVQPISGGDPEDGIDLQGNFLYAFNVSSAGAAGKAGDADFTADTAPGITVIAPSDIPAWDTPEYGDTPADDVIEKVTQSIRYGPNVTVKLANLVPGSTYKLQLLFYEQCCYGRGFNVYADGEVLATDFSPPEIQGDVNYTGGAAMVSAEFTTQRNQLVISLDTRGRTREDLTDPNAILDAVTLEILKLSDAVIAPTITNIAKDDNGVSITLDTLSGKTYTLEYKQSLTDATWAAGDQKTATGASTVLSDTTPAHLGGTQGFWRISAQ